MGKLWRGWRDVLARLGFENAALDAKLLTGHALGHDSLAMATREGELVNRLLAAEVADLLQRRISGESVARIIGEKEFYGLAFGLNAATLEPRPDTELLVDLALAALPANGRLLDLGTGTGCIPIAILANRPDATGLATDLDAEALDMARQNAGRHGVAERLDFGLGNWFEALAAAQAPAAPPLPGRERHGLTFDLIVSNPPYIASAVIDTLAPEVKRFDPLLALDGGTDGLAPYRIIAGEALPCLRAGGRVLVEIGYDQGAAVAALFRAAGFAEIAVHKDLAGLDRVVSAHQIEATTDRR
ncbi:peptide chain release factor N(5)-glutamine methyltransferase [Devosia sp. YIM 151766]|uniref:peptide chain release factor N(5)-glutamine methyltransferase n=1 Tax=Devosia sp. YIM 151766 TaxID=3017325 RepID=UPI00255D0AB6|nr:peptide chain release factor N(5)-glutamine methyltransferase [Devosia sp. YIM 151766]WIY54541.1 peptide chain release factor N(5)-glutamine methyltransferase [Devosia sp. YIM 151766]